MIGVLVVLAILYVVIVGNRFVRLRNESHQALSGIDIQLQRRADLIPNLVAVVQGYAAHESETFEAVTQARAQLMAAQTVAEKGQAAALTTAALTGLFGVAEAYPELKANEVFLKLQEQLDGHRGPARVGTQLLQRGRPALQHGDRRVPRQPDRRHALPACRVLPGRCRHARARRR